VQGVGWPLLSLAYNSTAMEIARILLLQASSLALSLDLEKLGTKIEAKMAMMAITIISSMRVKPKLPGLFLAARGKNEKALMKLKTGFFMIFAPLINDCKNIIA